MCYIKTHKVKNMSHRQSRMKFRLGGKYNLKDYKVQILIGFLLVAFVGTAFATRGFGLTVSSTDIFQLTPFNSFLKGYTVSYNDGQSQNIWTEGEAKFISGSKLIPDIGVAVSRPFFVNYNGNTSYLTNTQKKEYFLAQDPVPVENGNGSFYFLRTGTLAVDVLTRTFAKVPDSAFHSPINETPLARYSYGGINNVYAIRTRYWDTFRTYWGRPIGNPIETGVEGLLNARCNWNWGYDQYWFLGIVTAGIWDIDYFKDWQHDLHMRPISISIGDYRNKTENEAYLKTNFGNSQVRVTTKFQFDAIDDLIQYDYHQIINNKTFRIYSTDTKIAIIDSRLSQTYEKKGAVRNLLVPSLIINGDTTEPDKNTLEVTTESLEGVDTLRTSNVKKSTLFGGVSYLPSDSYSYNNISGGVVPDMGITKNFTYPSHININDFSSLPKSAIVTHSTNIRPLTSVDYAKYKIEYAGVVYSDTWWDPWTDDDVGTYNIDVPYRLRVQNTYGVSRILFDFVVLTTDNVQYIPTNGEPIDVKSLSDFNINDVGALNPDQDTINGTSSRTNYSPFEDWDLWWKENQQSIMTIIICVLVGLGLILAMGIVSKISKKQKTTEPHYT